MPAYVKQYLQCEDRAQDAESRVEDYKARVEENRWDQCRIAAEAVESGAFSRSSFAQAVGKSQSVISRQARLWADYGHASPHGLPSYSEVLAEVMGKESGSGGTRQRDLQGARQVLRNPDTAREVLSDPGIRRAILSDTQTRVALTRTREEIDAQNTAKATRKVRESAPALVEAQEYYAAMARVQHARADVNRALDLLRGLPPLDADARHDMKQEVDWLNASVEWLYELLKGRRSASLADEVAEFLAAEAAS